MGLSNFSLEPHLEGGKNRIQIQTLDHKNMLFHSNYDSGIYKPCSTEREIISTFIYIFK